MKFKGSSNYDTPRSMSATVSFINLYSA